LSHQLAKLPTMGNGFLGIPPVFLRMLIAARRPDPGAPSTTNFNLD
jgi:hypothetical protein